MPYFFIFKRNYAVFEETHTVTSPVVSIRLITLSSSRNWASVEIGTIVTESEIQASSVMKNSGRFSENIPMNFRSGVPLTLLGIIGKNFFFIKIFDRASTSLSTSL